MKPKTHYFIRTRQTWDNIQEIPPHSIDQEIGYYIPSMKFKSWVPNWLINLITK